MCYVCLAECSAPCTFTLGVDGESSPGNELSFTVRQWVESMTVECTARNNVSMEASVTTKRVQVLAGPANVSITGPELVVPGGKQRFLCHASCRPSCNFTWRFGSRWLGGHGNEISITAQKLAEKRILTCKAINSVSGLYAMASMSKNVAYGPSDVTIEGPDYVRLGKEATFWCYAECSPSCAYLWLVDGHTMEGQKLSYMAITISDRTKSDKILCEAQNIVSGKGKLATKTVSLEGSHGKSMAPQAELTLGLLLFALTLVSVILL
ncbi:pregnancy-specific beta-1-glycoprotein 5-like [Osmerus mordax]|uniref:pregnancy-specific beta-1-glycoprotein 5-like n=1 Tax=Osmerus mordax TaxID=8014 RepID=UPI00351071F1